MTIYVILAGGKILQTMGESPIAYMSREAAQAYIDGDLQSDFDMDDEEYQTIEIVEFRAYA